MIKNEMVKILFRGRTSLASTQTVSEVHLIGNNSEREPFMKPLASPRFCHMDEVFVAIGMLISQVNIVTASNSIL